MAEDGDLDPRQIDRLVALADGVINNRERSVLRGPVSDSLVQLGLAEVVGRGGYKRNANGALLYRITAEGADLFRDEWWHQLLTDKLASLPREPALTLKANRKTLIGGLVLLGAIGAGIAAGASLPRFVGETSPIAAQSSGRSPAAIPNSTTAAQSAVGPSVDQCTSTRSMRRKCPELPPRASIRSGHVTG